MSRDEATGSPSRQVPGRAPPLRLPATVCVEERLPPGMAGVLLNRRHSDRDLYLPTWACRRRDARTHANATKYIVTP